jgi:hypothetical protein
MERGMEQEGQGQEQGGMEQERWSQEAGSLAGCPQRMLQG